MNKTKIEKFLILNGWYPSRKVDISKMEKWYQSEEYELFDTAKGFLEEFGYIHLIFMNNRTEKESLFSSRTDLIIDPLIPSLESWVVADYNKQFNTIMIPIGEKSQGALTICIDIQGSFYIAFGDIVKKVGTDFYDMINTFFDKSSQPALTKIT